MPELDNLQLEAIEPERYELFEAPAYDFPLNRRELLQLAASGILLTVLAPGAAAQAGGPAARLHIGDDGTVTVFTGKVEVGQGARTEIAMAAAEELKLPLERVKVVMADTDVVPNDGITAGSRSTPATIPAVRRASASARELLAKSGKADYAELAKEAGFAESLKKALGADVTVTAVKDWKVLGTSRYRTDGREIVTGAHKYPSDIQLPNMLYGAVVRPPAYRATLESLNLAAAGEFPDVQLVQDGDFAGCTAPSSYAARRAAEAVAAKSKWKMGEHPPSTKIFDVLEMSGKIERARVSKKGEFDKAMGAAEHTHVASYRIAYIQHAPMEPRAAVAEWTNGASGPRLTVYTGTQNPHGVRSQLAQAFHMPQERVRVIVPDTGGGFGGKHTGEVAIEAARLAKHANQPVSLRWTRAEEFMWAYFRPAGVIKYGAALDDQGVITSWDVANYNAGAAAIESPYKTANTRTRFIPCESPLREGSYRGIAATANNFGRECFIDELARLAELDPVEFRLKNLDNPRLRDVLTAAAEKFGWAERRKKSRPNVGIGVACGTEKGSYVAACAEVEIVNNEPVVREFHLAFECGAILNPANLRAQVEGSIIQGLGGALTEEIRFANGKLENGRFAQYRVPRFKDVPPFEVHLLDRKDLAPAGAGETPIIAVAPAIANAVLNATGKSSRAMPVRVA